MLVPTATQPGSAGHGRHQANLQTRSMAIARGARASRGLGRRGRPLAAVVLALFAASSTVVPVMAGPTLLSAPAADPSPTAEPSPTSEPTPATTPSPTPEPSPTTEPSSSPSPSPPPDPTPSPEPTPTPSPSPEPTPTPLPTWPTTITPAGPTLTFYGRGYGHGVGLSQYGARGRALSGETSAQILAAYYRRSAPSTTSPTRTVRVLVLQGYRATAASPLTIFGRSGSWRIAGVSRTFPADALLRVWRTTATVNGRTNVTWRLRVLAADRITVLYAAKVSGSIVVRPTDGAGRLQL
jgi:outer membrane biosynthesis protein TonB